MPVAPPPLPAMKIKKFSDISMSLEGRGIGVGSGGRGKETTSLSVENNCPKTSLNLFFFLLLSLPRSRYDLLMIRQVISTWLLLSRSLQRGGFQMNRQRTIHITGHSDCIEDSPFEKTPCDTSIGSLNQLYSGEFICCKT